MSTKEETRKHIGQRVRILRTQAGLTQQKLAAEFTLVGNKP